MSETTQRTTADFYDADYYERGKQTGKSNYENYRWLREATVLCYGRMLQYLGAHRGDSVLDWGCAKGFGVKAMRWLGYEAHGYDISEYAIENCDPEIQQWVGTAIPKGRFDWAVLKDVLEHCERGMILEIVSLLLVKVRRGFLIVVPLGDSSTGEYFAPQDNADKSHITCMSLPEWLDAIQDVIDSSKAHWVVQGGYKLPGVKEACDPHRGSVAFITVRAL